MSPSREDLGIEDIALECPFGFGVGANEEELPQIAGGGVEPIVCSCERCDLIRTGFQQIGIGSEVAVSRDGINVPAIARSDQQRVATQGKRINDVISRTPDSPRSALRSDGIDLSPAGHGSRGRNVCNLRRGSVARGSRRILSQSQR